MITQETLILYTLLRGTAKTLARKEIILDLPVGNPGKHNLLKLSKRVN